MKRKQNRQSGHMLLYIVVGLIVVAVLVLAVWRIHSHKKSTSPNASSSMAQTNSGQVGSTNNDLTTELNGVGSSLNQENGSQNSATSAVNDQQNEVTVPTN